MDNCYDNHYTTGMEDYYEDRHDRNTKNSSNEKRSKPPRYYPSNRPQTLIKNAVTGVPYPFIVGSKEQSILYKIVDTTGRCDSDGYFIKLRTNLPNANTNHLFFDSPEQCMSHLRLTLNPDHVKRWHDKRSNELTDSLDN
jgi:hypothetical protein